MKEIYYPIFLPKIRPNIILIYYLVEAFVACYRNHNIIG